MFEKLEELAKNNKKISDFHIRAGSPLAYRQTGEIIKVPDTNVTAQDLKDMKAANETIMSAREKYRTETQYNPSKTTGLQTVKSNFQKVKVKLN